MYDFILYLARELDIENPSAGNFFSWLFRCGYVQIDCRPDRQVSVDVIWTNKEYDRPLPEIFDDFLKDSAIEYNQENTWN